MPASPRFLLDLQRWVSLLEVDLRQQTQDVPEFGKRMRALWQAARDQHRTAATFDAWLGDELP